MSISVFFFFIITHITTFSLSLISNISEKVREKWTEMAKTLSQKILTSRYNDMPLAVGLLHRLDKLSSSSSDDAADAYTHINNLTQANITVFETVKTLAEAGLVLARLALGGC